MKPLAVVGVPDAAPFLLLHGKRGVVSVEMLLAFFPVLFGFLGVIQLSLLMMGKMVVTHAAGRASRAAVVVLDDDPSFYDEAPRGNLTSGKIPPEGSFSELWAGVNNEYTALLFQAPPIGGARLGAIRQAAYHPLSVLAPALPIGKSETLADELGGPSVDAWGAHVSMPELRIGLFGLLYNRAAASITVHTDPEDSAVTSVDAGEEITVRVSYLMKCGVPLVSTFICQDAHDIVKASISWFSTEEGENTLHSLSGVESPVLRDLMLAGGGRFLLLTADATLPNHGAEYHEDE